MTTSRSVNKPVRAMGVGLFATGALALGYTVSHPPDASARNVCNRQGAYVESVFDSFANPDVKVITLTKYSANGAGTPISLSRSDFEACIDADTNLLMANNSHNAYLFSKVSQWRVGSVRFWQSVITAKKLGLKLPRQKNRRRLTRQFTHQRCLRDL